MMRPQKGIAVIVGVGPKLGKSIGHKFARQGYSVAILARDIDSLEKHADEIATNVKFQVYAIQIDCSQTSSIMDAFESILSLGLVEVFVYNADILILWNSMRGFNHTKMVDFQRSMTISFIFLFLCAHEVLPNAVKRRKRTIIFKECSSSFKGMTGFTDFCSGKFAMRGLSQCLALEYHWLGVHVAHVVIDDVIGGGKAARADSSGCVSSSGEPRVEGGDTHSMHPDALVETYWYLHTRTIAPGLKKSFSAHLP